LWYFCSWRNLYPPLNSNHSRHGTLGIVRVCGAS
jgi:hypothetical protein